MVTAKEPTGTTPLDPDEAKGLRLPIRTREALDLAEEQNIVAARAWASRSRLVRSALLDASTLRRIHKEMLGAVWDWAGSYRTTEKNIGIPPKHISSAVYQLCKNMQYRLDHMDTTADALAVEFHHQLVFIHPFPNGNGRHARFCADRLIESLGGSPFTWGSGDPHKSGAVREAYLHALKEADQGNLGPLVAFSRST